MLDMLYILIPVVALVWLLKGRHGVQDTNTPTSEVQHSGFSITRSEYNTDMKTAFLKGLELGAKIKGQGLEVVEDKGQLLVGVWYKGKFATTHTINHKTKDIKPLHDIKRNGHNGTVPTEDYVPQDYVQ